MFATLLMSWACQFQTQIVANSAPAAVAAPATRAQSKTCSSWQKREWKLVAKILTVGFAGTDMGRELVVAGSAIDPDRWFWWSKIWRSRSSGIWVGWWWQHSAQILTVGSSRGTQRVGHRWWWQDSAQISTVGFCCQNISSGVVTQVGKGFVVAGEAAQIVTVGFVAEDLERESGTVGRWQEQRLDLDRWIRWQRSHGGS